MARIQSFIKIAQMFLALALLPGLGAFASDPRCSDLLPDQLALLDGMVSRWEMGSADSLLNILEPTVLDSCGRQSYAESEILLRRARIARASEGTAGASLTLEALQIRRRCLDPQDRRLVPVLIEQARALGKLGAYSEARSALDEGLGLLDSLRLEDQLPLAEVQHEIGVLLLSLRNFLEAEPMLTCAWTSRQRLLGDSNPATGKTRLFLGILKSQTGRVEQARVDFEAALASLSAGLGTFHPEYLWALNTYATYLQWQGKLPEAREIYEQILVTRKETWDREDLPLAWTLHNLAIVHEELSNFTAAESLLSEAYRIRHKLLGNQPLTARSLVALGSLQFLRGDYVAAQRPLEEALEIFQDHRLGDEAEAGNCLMNLGALHYWTGDPEKAQTYFERALPVMTAKGRLRDRIECLQRLAESLAAQDQFQKAERLYRQALDLTNQEPETLVDLRAAVRVDLATCLVGQGRIDEADFEFESSVAEIEMAHGPEAFDLMWTLSDYGHALLQKGDYRQAETALLRSVKLFEKYLEGSHPDLVRCLLDLSRAHVALGKPDAAWETAMRAHRLETRHLGNNVVYMSEQYALRYRETLESTADRLVLLLAGARNPSQVQIRQAWEAVVDRRMLVLDELLTRNHEETRGGAGKESEALVKAKTRLANLYVRGARNSPEASYEQFLKEAIENREVAEQKWAAARASTRAQESEDVRLDQLLTRLPAKALLLAYVRYQTSQARPGHPESKAYGVFIAGKTGLLSFVNLGTAKPIELAASDLEVHLAEAPLQLKQSPRETESRYLELASRLRQAVWDPVAALARDATELRIVPDGALQLISFPALPLADGRFLIEESFVLSTLTAEKDLLRVPGRMGRGMLALGNPDFNLELGSTKPTLAVQLAGGLRGGTEACQALQDLSFGSLPAAEGEARGVGRSWHERHADLGPEIELLGSAATEKAFKSQAPGCLVLHLSTHAFILNSDCLSRNGVKRLPMAEAGLWTGLALAGANRRHELVWGSEDGILTAEEISALNLSGVALVVLSACNSGLGMAQSGEGVMGLRRAFQAAGVKTLLLSLWPVEDRLTEQWMTAFYEILWTKGQGPALACHLASQTMLFQRRTEKRNLHPFYWGSFISVGDAN